MKKIIIIMVMMFACALYASGTIVSEETKGNLKYCVYSDGVVITIKAFEICPRYNN